MIIKICIISIIINNNNNYNYNISNYNNIKRLIKMIIIKLLEN